MLLSNIGRLWSKPSLSEMNSSFAKTGIFQNVTFITQNDLYNCIWVSFSLKCFIYELCCINNYNSSTGASWQTVANYIIGTSLNESRSDMHTPGSLWKGNPFPWWWMPIIWLGFHMWLVHLSMQNKYAVVCTHTAHFNPWNAKGVHQTRSHSFWMMSADQWKHGL